MKNEKKNSVLYCFVLFVLIFKIYIQYKVVLKKIIKKLVKLDANWVGGAQSLIVS